MSPCCANDAQSNARSDRPPAASGHLALKLVELDAAVRAHSGQFYCERIGKPQLKKTVAFRHIVIAPLQARSLPTVGRLADFYDTFESVVFYSDERSGDAAKHIASPDRWTELHSDFSDWFGHLSEDDRAEILPEWIESCVVIGEEPRTGNYILIPTEGADAGHVYLFDHDGYEFTDCAEDLISYVEKLLAPDDALLLEMATHMRFVDEADNMEQWWIRELKDNRGNAARTHV